MGLAELAEAWTVTAPEIVAPLAGVLTVTVVAQAGVSRQHTISKDVGSFAALPLLLNK